MSEGDLTALLGERAAMVQPHVASFNDLFLAALPVLPLSLPPLECKDTTGRLMRVSIIKMECGMPEHGAGSTRTVS